MNRFRKFSRAKPTNLIEFVWFAVTNFFSVNSHFKIESYPMRLFSQMFPVDIPKSHKFAVQNIRAVFLLYFFLQCIFNRVSELQAPATAVPYPVFVAAIAVSLIK